MTETLVPEPTVPLSVLDFVGIEHGEAPHESIEGAVGIAQAADAAGFRRYWVSEHHNMRTLACSAPEILIAHVGARTQSIRVGAAGIMLPNHAAFKVAETFRTLLAMYPGRIDLGLGRAPGTDPLTAHVLRRGRQADPAAEFPEQVAELLAFLDDAWPEGHPYGKLVAAPVVDDRPDVFVLGSSPYGPRFAAVNGLSAVFAHHQSPDLAIDLLRAYRDEFTPRTPGARPYSAVSVVVFASHDPDAVLLFEAGWTLTLLNMRRGRREPLRPEEVQDFARSDEFLRSRTADSRMLTGEPKVVVERLRELQEQTRTDEIVLATPSIDRAHRAESIRLLADAWRQTA
jgi:luciferase family oxidoreductase group 1